MPTPLPPLKCETDGSHHQSPPSVLVFKRQRGFFLPTLPKRMVFIARAHLPFRFSSGRHFFHVHTTLLLKTQDGTANTNFEQRGGPNYKLIY